MQILQVREKEKSMPRNGITIEEVETHADHFISKGENPTIEKIRHALGNRGSNSTISKHLNEWKQKKSIASNANAGTIYQKNISKKINNDMSYLILSDTSTPISPLLPELPELPAPLNQAINQTWQQLLEEAQKQANKIIEDAKEEASKTYKEATIEVEKVKSELLEKDKVIVALNTELNEVKRIAAERKQEFNVTQQLMMKEKEKIAKLEERLNHIKLELEVLG